MKQIQFKKQLWIAGISFFLLLLISRPAFAAVKTGGIDVEVVCYEECADGTKKIFENLSPLMPREQRSHVIAVKNNGSDAWIRLRISYTGEDGQTKQTMDVDDSWLYGISKDWVKRGDHWYYKKPVSKGTEVEFCKGLQIPDFNNLPRGMKISVTMVAEAVQSSHVTIDLYSEDPFAHISIEKNPERRIEASEIHGFEIHYEKETEKFVLADGLFQDLEEIMPGDTFVDTLPIHNKTNAPVRVYLREFGTVIDSLVLKTLQLRILRKDVEIYHGAFADHALKNGILLGRFSTGSKEELKFEISMPLSAGNETAFQEIPIQMIFSVETVREHSEDENEEPIISENDRWRHPSPDPSVKNGEKGGKWKLIDPESHRWEYVFKDGSKAKDGWYYLYNPYSPDENKMNWFYFREQGTMQFGWIRTENQNWYFCHEISDGNLGTLKRGWHYDQDDLAQYYLDPVTGIMQTGWRNIEGSFYYFTPLNYATGQSWFWNTEVGRWLFRFFGYRTYGSMYRNEMTPDGYLVDDTGVWNGE